MSIIIPHVFQDGVDEVISGVQHNENYEVLKLALEALEGKTAWSPPSGRVARTFNTTYLASGTRNVIVEGDFDCKRGSFVHLLVGGVFVKELGFPETYPDAMRVCFTLAVPAGEEWEAVIAIFSAGPGQPADLHSSYTAA